MEEWGSQYFTLYVMKDPVWDDRFGRFHVPGEGKGWRKLKGTQGWKDAQGNIWKKDKLHKDHWDILDRKGNKIMEVDFEGRQLWPEGPKHKTP